MAASSRDAIVKMAKKLLQRPQGDPDEVQRLADETINAVVQSSQAYSGGGQRLKGKQAAQASACVVAALQCAGWLVQAAWGLKRQVNEGTCTEARKMRLHVRMGDAHAVSGKCIEEATTWAARLDMGQVGLDLLRAVTRPAAGDRVPGVTTWLPWAAELELALVDSFAALGFPADFHRSFSGDIAPSLALWALLLNTALVHSNSFPIHPATWLAPPLLRLAHHALLRVRTAGAGHSIVLRTALKAAASNLSWRMHPHLCLWVTGSPADAVLSRTAAKALRQDIWWHALATCSRGLIQQVSTLTGIKHPCAKRLAAYSRHGYFADLLSSAGRAHLEAHTSCALHVLLLAELWDVWPWQLEQLQQLQAAATAARSSGSISCGASGSGTRSSTSCERDGHSYGGDGGSSSGSVRNDSGNSSSSTVSGGMVGSSHRSEAAAVTTHALRMDLARTVHVEFLMLPEQQRVAGTAAGPTHPVTLQQLQLVTCAMYQCHPTSISSAALLLTLLLQRADPGLRAEFLGSPMGSFMVDVIARSPGSGRLHGYNTGWCVSESYPSPQAPQAQLKALLAGTSDEQGVGFGMLPQATSSLLMLAWAHLEVRREGVPQQEPGVREDLYRCVLLTPPRAAPLYPDHECLVVEALPSTAFRFLPGLAPSLELFAAAEQLLRDQMAAEKLPLQGLSSVAVLLHAAVEVLVKGSKPMRAGTTSNKSNCSSGGGGGGGGNSMDTTNSSSSSGGGGGSGSSSTTTTNSSGGGDSKDTIIGARSSGSNGGSSSSSSSRGDANGSAAGASANTASATEEGCGPGIQQVLSSLAVSACSTVHRLKQFSGFDSPTLVLWVFNPCSLIAADLLQLATHQLQQPQANHAAAMRLAAAAQRLAGACMAHVEDEVNLLKHGSAGMETTTSAASGLSSAAGQLQASQQPQQQAGTMPPAGTGAAPGSTYSSSDLQLFHSSAAVCLRALPRLLLQLQSVIGRMEGPVDTYAKGHMAAAAECVPHGDMDPARDDAQCLLSAMRSCRPRVQLVGCGNSRCTNLSGPSAEGLVAGRKGVRCGGCRVARYCSPACQQAAWPQHRHVCRRLAAAAGQGQVQG